MGDTNLTVSHSRAEPESSHTGLCDTVASADQHQLDNARHGELDSA
jgi:hypothetical protein